MMIDYTLIKNLILRNNEEIIIHLKNLNCELYLNNMIHKWLITLFIEGVSDIFHLIIWDLFLLEGSIVFFKAAYGLIKIMSKDILEAKTIENIQNIFENKIINYDNTAKLIYFLVFKIYDNFNIDILNKYRKFLLPKIKNQIGNSISDFFNEIKEEEIECDLDWPLCSKDQNYRHEIIEFIIYKQLEKPIVINDYYGNNLNFEKTKKENNEKDQYDYYSEICIERRKHICDSKIESIKDILNDRYINKEINLLQYQNQRKKTFISFNSSKSNMILSYKDESIYNKIVEDIEKENENIIQMPKQNIDYGLEYNDN